MILPRSFCVLILFCVSPLLWSQPLERSKITIFVAPDGSDLASGSERQPLSSLRGARDFIRRMSPAEREHPIDVTVRSGVYELSETLQFLPRDSGTSRAPVRYRSADGETVTLSGGRRIRTPWTSEDGKVYHTDIPEAKDGRWPFKQLFVNGRRAVRARFPNANATLEVIADGADQLTLAVPPGTAKPVWARTPGALLNIVAEKHWFNEIVEIARVSDDGSAITIRGREAQGRIQKGNFFFIEGVREELDQPGEWHLDLESGRLYYWPEHGDPNSLEIVAPRLDRAVEFAGGPAGPDHVRHIELSGFTVANLDYSVGHLATRTTQDAAVKLVNAWNCAIEDSRFTNIGGYAVWLHLDSCENRIANNHMWSLGSGGVLTTSARFAYATSDMIFEPDPAVAEFTPLRNEISGNHIHQGGLIRRYCSGVHLDSRPLSTSLKAGNRIANNHIHDMPRNGIFGFANQGGHIIENNRIHDIIQVVDDGGAVHLATMNPLAAPTLIRGNVFRRIGTRPEMLANGVFLDWLTSHVRIENNVVTDTVHGAVKILGGDDVVVINNIIANDPVSLVVTGNWGVPSQEGVRMEHNVFVNDRSRGQFFRFFTGVYLKTSEAVKRPGQFALSNFNLFWNSGAPVRNLVTTGTTPGKSDEREDIPVEWAAWQAAGADPRSLVADPRLVETPSGGLAPAPGSPVEKIGFKRVHDASGGSMDAGRSPADFDSLERAAVFVSDEDSSDFLATGPWRSERAVLAGQAHTFFTQLVSALANESSERTQLTAKALLPADGRYEVWLRWFEFGPKLSTRTPVTIVHAAGVRQLAIDQSVPAPKWRRLGVFDFKAGEAQLILSNQGVDGPVAFKAAAFVRVR